ncbi:cytochrome c [Deinococcus cavernae]|uniref:Cytochrome c n=1 Tax=Deinococcus cavernae TaxID=2320857 RepID=A0A418V7J8_9DEIO|nr:cytochrome c [Deinococcus cavernae]RJF72046.1 cytochrome c [Deinococcus cavernae]
MIYFILMAGTLMFVLLLWPALGAARVTREDTRRLELEEEKEQLLLNVQELQAAGADAGLLTREKVRLTQVLQELDSLPPAPVGASGGRGEARPALPLALVTLGLVGALTILGAFTVFPKWRYAGMPPGQASQLRNAVKLPVLQARAEKSGTVADNLALGDAAWDAQNYQLAAKSYTSVLMKERSNAKALRRTGFYLLQTEAMAKDGLGFIQRGVEAAPKDPEGQLLYGYALGLFGQYREGLAALQQYQALAPDGHEADDLIVEFQGKLGAAVDGKLVYAQNCAACHGAQGEGGTGRKLVGSPALRSEPALRSVILNGGAGMPAFPQLQGASLDALVKFMQGW